MESGSVRSSLGCAAVLWLLLASSTAAAEGPVVQRIGEPGSIAAAVAAAVTVVPLSPDRDARATPIILAAGKAFVTQDGKAVDGLEAAEQMALREAYDAGQPILLLDASTHDIEALHMLLEDGVALESSTDPVVLAYVLRQESDIPSARLVIDPVEDDVGEGLGELNEDERGDAELALSRAIEIVVEELTRPPAPPQDAPPAGDLPDWRTTPVQKTTLSSTKHGTYHTPVEVYALHSCHENKDYYLVNTNSDWTPLYARFQSASLDEGQITVDPDGNLIVNWQEPVKIYCDLGIEIFNDSRICRYVNYPLSYSVALRPPSGPTVLEADAAPAEDRGLSSEYDSGLSFRLDGPVEVSGDGPGGGLQAGVSWDNIERTRVPPLVLRARGLADAGLVAEYLYCTSGDHPGNCTSAIQITGSSGLCRDFIVGDPQLGQTRVGELRHVQQTVYWQVDPATYAGATTFDITVSWRLDVATSTALLWFGKLPRPGGPVGYCNPWGCDCHLETVAQPVELSHTFKVPLPSSGQCPS